MNSREINILDYWELISRKWKAISFIIFFCTSLSVIISLILPKTFKSEAVLLPLNSKGGGGLGAAISQSGLGSLFGGLSGGFSNPAQIMAILQSTTLAEMVIDRNHLISYLFPERRDTPSMEEAVSKLREQVIFVEDKKNQTISISAIFKDQQLAASVANDYVKVLYQHLSQNTFTSSKRNRLFIEKQLERNKAELLLAGKELASFYSANQISNTTPRIDVDVTLGVSSPIISDSVDAEKISSVVGAEAKDLMERSQKVNEYIEQIKLVKDVPQQVYLQYLTLRQELLSKINALLTQQYELAKVDENKDELTFQVIDWGRVPIRRYKPRRTQIVILTFAFSLFLSIFYVVFVDYIVQVKKTVTRRER